MDAYPHDYVEHNLPLIVLSGLGSDSLRVDSFGSDDTFLKNGITIRSETPSINGERAEHLLQEFLSQDGTGAPWNATARKTKGGPINFKLRAVGREFVLPPQKAEPPVSEFSPPGTPIVSNSHGWVLHSPLSPLSPCSSLFPDGIMAPQWISKHQNYVPSAFVSFFPFGSDPNKDSLNDNQLKNEINAIKTALQKSNYKTRYAVVLLSEASVVQSPDVDERLANIKRATGLDPKNSFFFLPPNASRVEVTTFVQAVLTALQPSCIEYYRDLTKHARRKKGRGSIPPPTAPPTRGTSQTLSSQGWGVRYDFKLGVFAEFRQEMDSAGRHYSFALDALLGTDGIFETIPSWSPRWDETRLLADTIAFRSLRCMLWNNQPTSAVQAWSLYRHRMRSVVERKGKGSTTYGWEAWESRWAKIMAEMVERSELPVFKIPTPMRGEDTPAMELAIYSPPEKAFPIGERCPPWHQLHHPGYWLNLAAQHAMRRRAMAEEIPEEDRSPPGQSPATQVALRYRTYDTYLVPEPHVELPLDGTDGFDHIGEILDLVNQAVSHFFSRGQLRFVDRLNLQVGMELLRSKRYGSALGVLKPVWEGMSWRKDGWWNLVTEVTWTLHQSALRCSDAEMIVATEWELLCNMLYPCPGKKHDLMGCLDLVNLPPSSDKKPCVSLSANDVARTVAATFAFSEESGHVGEPMRAQIALQSFSRKNAAPVVLSSVTIGFTGCLSEVKIEHSVAESTGNSASEISELSLQESGDSSHSGQVFKWSGSTDLTLFPGQIKVFQFPLYFRDSGDVTMSNSVIEIKTDKFELIFNSPTPEDPPPPVWWYRSPGRPRNKRISSLAGTQTKVLPKPPKMEISLPAVAKQFYTDERVTLDIELTNGEDQETEVVLEVRLLGRAEKTLSFSWTSGSEDPENAPDLTNSSGIDLPGHQVGQIPRGDKRTQSIRFTAPDEPSEYTLEIKALYHLISDRETPISKILTSDLIFVSPFEASYDFTPRVHPDPWPSFFNMEDASTANASTNYGIAQTWLFTSRIASFADASLTIEDATLVLHSAQGGVSCELEKASHPDSPSPIEPHELQDRGFLITTRKQHMEERRSSSLEMGLQITWRRTSTQSRDSSSSVTSTLHIPRLILPTSEPRVLLSARQVSSAPSDTQILHLDYTLENPTFHFLTFELSMEAAEDFAFSGPKLRALNLLPMSRRAVRYRVLPLGTDDPDAGSVAGKQGKGRVEKGKEGKKVRKVIEPNLVVVDRYFKKTLKVVGCEGCGNDKKGPVVFLD